MNRLLLFAASLATTAASAFGQGQFIFANNAATAITNGLTDLPVPGSAAQDDTQVTVYIGNVGDPTNSLALTGPVTNVWVSGRFNGGTRTVNVSGPVQMQVRAWLANTVYPSYETAVAAAQGGDGSVLVGVSAPFNFTLTTPPTTPNSIATFLTPIVLWPPPALPHTASTLAATRATYSTAQLNGMVTAGNLPTTCWFEWGTVGGGFPNTTAPQAAGSGNSVVYVTNNISGLTAAREYQCRLVASNSLGVVHAAERRWGVGPITAWGDNSLSQTNVPAGLNDAVAITGGVAGYHSLALRADGSVVAWRFNAHGQATVPAGLSNVVAVAGGGRHSLALRADGTVVTWGENGLGQTSVPVGLSNVVALAAGGYHSLALRANGTVVAWGWKDYGITNVPAGLSNVVAIAGGTFHSLALRADGSVVAWGDNSAGQSTVPAGLSNVVAIAAGGYHSLGLRADGSVVAWGGNDYGQKNVPAGLSDAVAIAAGYQHSLALRVDGSVVAWGRNDYGQTTVPAGLNDVVAIAGGGVHSLALRAAAPPAVSLAVSGYPATTTANVAHNFTVTAKDAYGTTVTNYSGTVHFTSSDPQSGPPANYTFLPGDAGSHVFSMKFGTAGLQSVTALDTVTASITGTQSNILVLAGPVTGFAISGLPSPMKVGVAGSFTLRAKDSSGNTATNHTGTVHFTSTDPSAVLPANYTFTVGDAGIHTFAPGATFNTAGTRTLTVTDTGDSNINGSQIVYVGLATTTTRVTPAPNPSVFGQPVTLTASVTTTNAGTPTGTVTFNDGLNGLGSASLVGGSAQLITSNLTVGTHGITAAYSGDASYIPSTSAVTNVSVCGTNITVVNANDSGPGSLREALVNVCPGGTIDFTNTFSGSKILLTSGQLEVTKSLTILGPGAKQLAIDGGGSNRVFYVSPGVTNLIAGLTLNHGHSDSAGGGLYNDHAFLTVSNVTIAGSSANAGGGIYNDGLAGVATLTIQNSTLSGNSASGSGGGVFNDGGGGAATLVIQSSTLSGNSANGGGAIYNDGGGGAATLAIQHSTLSGNSATAVGGIFNNFLGSGTLTVNHTLLAKGSSGDNYYSSSGSATDSDYNLSDDFSAGSFASHVNDLWLAPLADNGGPTLTCAPLPNSPAINAGTTDTNGLPEFDQRGPGFPRVLYDTVDIGAVELLISYSVVNTQDAGPGSLRQALDIPAGGVITFDPALNGQTIRLTSGALNVNRSLIIVGPGANLLSIDGGSNRVFYLSPGLTNIIAWLTITNGYDAINGGGVYNNRSVLTLKNVTLSGNSCGGSGGAIFNQGSGGSATMLLVGCTLSGNSAGVQGGGIHNDHALLTLQNCTLSGNSGVYYAGGIYNAGDNGASATLSVVHCTFGGNSAGFGASGIFNNGVSGSATFVLSNSIAAGVRGVADIENLGTFIRQGANIVARFKNENGGTDSGPALLAVWPSMLPIVAPLSNYGGPTRTMPPMPGSPALDGCVLGSGLFIDQRGFTRPKDNDGDYAPIADIGAVEGVHNPAGPGVLTGLSLPRPGWARFEFTYFGTFGAYTVYATTNLALPFLQWSNLGNTVVESPIGSGEFIFTDTQVTNLPMRFYRVTSP